MRGERSRCGEEEEASEEATAHLCAQLACDRSLRHDGSAGEGGWGSELPHLGCRARGGSNAGKVFE